MTINYNNTLLTSKDFNDSISGTSEKYRCWGFNSKEISRLSNCNNFISVGSILRIEPRNNLVRSYTFIDFFENISRLSECLEKHPTINSFFIIPLGDNIDSQDVVIQDISQKHNL